MHSWSAPEVPRGIEPSEAANGPVRIFDTASQALTDSTPSAAEARLYVCGITPYDATHLGHAATYLAFDLLQRQWRDQGFDVHYVQNVTDVDDPLLERATATGQNWEDLAVRETELFREDMTALRILPPRHYIGAVESIPLVIDMIERLQAAGAVYAVDDDLYFSVRAAESFGSISNYSIETMMTFCRERGGDPERSGKRDPLDCLLWQAERPGEPAWESPFGKGRPGWHIECAAIAVTHLGTTFDVQGGGSDLIFPHHEMSAAQASVDSGKPFAHSYVHTGMVGYEGEKMSKSRGNLVLVSKLRATGYDPMAIRLALLQQHYRSDWEWQDPMIDAASEQVTRWKDALTRATGPASGKTITALRVALRNDLDAPAAVAVIDTWCTADGEDADAPAQIAIAIDALLGLAL